MLFLGKIEAKIDSKGRAFLPASFRKTLQLAGEERLVIRKDVYQPCLTLYPESEWKTLLGNLRSRLNRWNPKHQQVLREYLESVELVNLDASGRLLLSRKNLEALGIETDIKFLGMGDYIEIWKNSDQSFMDQESFKTAISELMSETMEAP